MASESSDRMLLIGFLLGTGVGLAAAMLIDPAIRSRLRAVLLDGAGDVADRVASIGRGPHDFRTRQEARADRTIQRRIDRMRTAGL